MVKNIGQCQVNHTIQANSLNTQCYPCSAYQSLSFLFRKNCQDQHKALGTGSYLGMVHFHHRRINRVWHFSQPPRHANLRPGSSSTVPKGPQPSTPGGSFKSRGFDMNPVSDQIASLRVRWPLYKLRGPRRGPRQPKSGPK